jgi:ABC-type branched-subunit amino acid transport system substrate-binding protein
VIWLDDLATGHGALAAAEQIVRSDARAVVGHFASAAASTAAPIYRSAHLPLLLPAATAHELTAGSGVYRLCDSDLTYIAWICDFLDANHIDRLFVESDGSLHGNSIRGLLTRRLPHRIATEPDSSDALLFSGRFEPSLEFALRYLRQGETRPVLLTDDAQSERLAEELPRDASNVFVMGFKVETGTPSGQELAHSYRRKWSRPPGIYYFETVAAVQVAATWIAADCVGAPVDTVFGHTCFDERGESNPLRFVCMQPRNGKLTTSSGAAE